MEFEQDIIHCLNTLHNGGIILYPTDTIWGIGCDACNPEAVNKIVELKKREAVKSMIVLVADPRDINRYSSRPEPFIFDYLAKTTKPTTVIYDGALGIADNLIARDGSVAIRIVREDFCRHLIKRFRKPLVSTSANISGTAAPENFNGIADMIKNGVDYIVKYRQEETTAGVASALIRFNAGGEAVVLRP